MLLLLIIRSTNCGFTITLPPLLPAIFSLSITLPDSCSKLALTQDPFLFTYRLKISSCIVKTSQAFFWGQIYLPVAPDTSEMQRRIYMDTYPCMLPISVYKLGFYRANQIRSKTYRHFKPGIRFKLNESSVTSFGP